jgi:N utilization substance protein B
VIDEYVELAKVYGAEESFRYVNAVLDRLAQSVRAVEHRAS